MIKFVLNLATMIITSFLTAILDMFAGVDMTGLETAVTTLVPYLKVGLYILPAKTMGQIFSVIVGIWSTRLIIKSIKTLLDILPFA
jgi:hypothetical protein